MKILLKITAIAGLSLLSHQLMAQSSASNQVAAKDAFSTSMGTGQLRFYNGLVAVLENFDFDYKYDIVSYDAVLIKKNSQDAVSAKGYGPLFEKNRRVNELIKDAKPGDRLIFENIKVKGEKQPERFAKGSLTITVR
ncbi:MAG: hypothetical protein BGO31_18230 [Bacteroidetes bacterium 43-16]|nr:MAG: hypothetical protein BGO31_18230 [Bacteroidetes bacterium 43-16]